ncbi:histidinol-phosphate transaminase [Rhodophyticola sp. CCM32]|nr:histidinol-phosphate transaminase [Rhodophyticola sp. CCM32]
MADLGKLIRRELDQMQPYNAGLSLDEIRSKYDLDVIAKLASNENPNGPAPEVLRILRETSHDVYLYPDGSANLLRQKLARHLDFPEDQLIFGNGSEELISIICQSVLDPDDRVVTLYPSFSLHEEYAYMMGANVERVSVTSDLDIDLEALIEAAAHPAKMLIFANPMNPVGCWLNPDDLQAVIRAKHPDTLLVLDEAYYEYAIAADYCSGDKMLLENGGNWIILRTFSKAWGLAGLRVGFGMCSSADLRKTLDLTRTPFNLNTSAQMAASASLDATAYMKGNIEKTISERSRVAAALSKLGYKIAPSSGNFLFFDTRAPSTSLADALLKRGTVVKPWKQAGFETFIRVSIGSMEENDKFIADLAR